MADEHFLIQKAVKYDTTVTNVERLEESSVVNEIARIISGDNISHITLKHAQEILSNSKKFKEIN
jgi:DNA repair protein RecN (Recombination protein N)